ERRAVDREPAQRHLVPEDADAVHAPGCRHRDVQPADRDADRQRLPELRVIDEEDGVRLDERPISSWDTTFPRPERDDAGTVRSDRRVVTGDPQAAGCVALTIGESREEDGAAGIELRLQPRRVVTDSATR